MLYFPDFLIKEWPNMMQKLFSSTSWINEHSLLFQIIPRFTTLWYNDFSEYTVTTDGIDDYKVFSSRYIKGSFGSWSVSSLYLRSLPVCFLHAWLTLKYFFLYVIKKQMLLPFILFFRVHKSDTMWVRETVFAS